MSGFQFFVVNEYYVGEGGEFLGEEYCKYLFVFKRIINQT